MSRHPQPLPPRLRLAPFSVREGRAAGLTDDRLRGRDLLRPYRGVRAAADRADGAGSSPDPLRLRLLHSAVAYLPLLRAERGELFSGTTALLLHGAPIRLTRVEVHVVIPRPHGPARTAGVHGHSTAVPFAPHVIRASGRLLPCVPPGIALIQAAPLLAFRELVVAADHLIAPVRGGSPLIAHAELIALAARSRGAGIQKLRMALQAARAGAESRMETLMHLELAKLGNDTLELQAVIRDRRGRFIGRFDAADRERRRIVEYDGEQHRTDRRQYLRDERRLDQVREEGFAVLRLHREDFFDAQLSSTGARMLAFLGRDPRPVPRGLARYLHAPTH
ncbi:endonuclease domain-containing protein [Leucobacter allii]|uniref:Endonuclease domain-containing protein n=1 Tax=Leucobacter allii TaxID=2932247 RepID=A0ABY4FPK8_9MICO|nr:DUF559 domain-containing protein [Leucobacter allii]UOQ58216.1 endonuclease domain-containing protein [Leucobacter allii]